MFFVVFVHFFLTCHRPLISTFLIMFNLITTMIMDISFIVMQLICIQFCHLSKILYVFSIKENIPMWLDEWILVRCLWRPKRSYRPPWPISRILMSCSKIQTLKGYRVHTYFFNKLIKVVSYHRKVVHVCDTHIWQRNLNQDFKGGKGLWTVLQDKWHASLLFYFLVFQSSCKMHGKSAQAFN